MLSTRHQLAHTCLTALLISAAALIVASCGKEEGGQATAPKGQVIAMSARMTSPSRSSKTNFAGR